MIRPGDINYRIKRSKPSARTLQVEKSKSFLPRSSEQDKDFGEILQVEFPPQEGFWMVTNLSWGSESPNFLPLEEDVFEDLLKLIPHSKIRKLKLIQTSQGDDKALIDLNKDLKRSWGRGVEFDLQELSRLPLSTIMRFLDGRAVRDMIYRSIDVKNPLLDVRLIRARDFYDKLVRFLSLPHEIRELDMLEGDMPLGFLDGIASLKLTYRPQSWLRLRSNLGRLYREVDEDRVERGLDSLKLNSLEDFFQDWVEECLISKKLDPMDLIEKKPYMESWVMWYLSSRNLEGELHLPFLESRDSPREALALFDDLHTGYFMKVFTGVSKVKKLRVAILEAYERDSALLNFPSDGSSLDFRLWVKEKCELRDRAPDTNSLLFSLIHGLNFFVKLDFMDILDISSWALETMIEDESRSIRELGRDVEIYNGKVLELFGPESVLLCTLSQKIENWDDERWSLASKFIKIERKLVELSETEK